MKLPSRNKKTHKGQNGNVLVIGGNRIFHGAPLLAALGTEQSGADLIFLMLPERHATAAKVASANFIIETFAQEDFSAADIERISFCVHSPGVLLLGNGLGKTPVVQQAIIELLRSTEVPVVLDADALIPEILKLKRHEEWILTPHSGEFKRLFNLSPTKQNVQKMAGKYGITILQKGVTDIIAGQHGEIRENKSGVPQMSVGGTGDALAGIIAGLWSQGVSAFGACETGAFLWGKCGEKLAKTKYSFSTEEMLEVFPEVAKQYSA